MNINLKQFRKKHNLTQADMAREVGVSLETYRRWEMEVVNPNEDNQKNLEKIIEKYN
jgi:DNA-binding XRE family transcriptional regulator